MQERTKPDFISHILGKGENFIVRSMNLKSGEFVKIHGHNFRDEAVYVLEGSLQIEVDFGYGSIIQCKNKGDVFKFEKGCRHGLFNKGNVPAYFLEIWNGDLVCPTDILEG